MITLRYSDVYLLTKCPKAFEYRYVNHVVIPRQGYLVLGSGCHYALARNYQHKIIEKVDMPITELESVFSDSWDKLKFGSYDEDSQIPIIWDEPKDLLKDIGITLLRCYHRDIAPSVVPLAVEQPFYKEITEGITLESRPDLITDLGIVDHKTAKRAKTKADADKDIQPTCHMIVTGGIATRYEFHMMLKLKVPRAEIISTSRTPEEIKWFKDEFLPPVVSLVKAGIFPHLGLNTWFCNPAYCGYFPICKRPGNVFGVE